VLPRRATGNGATDRPILAAATGNPRPSNSAQAGLCAGHYWDWAPRVIARCSVSAEDGLAVLRRFWRAPGGGMCARTSGPACVRRAGCRLGRSAGMRPPQRHTREPLPDGTDSNQTVDFPIPASPSTSSARGPRGTESQNHRIKERRHHRDLSHGRSRPLDGRSRRSREQGLRALAPVRPRVCSAGPQPEPMIIGNRCLGAGRCGRQPPGSPCGHHASVTWRACRPCPI
jgi:hypothetical protein